jgi:N-acetylglucosamine kinase-like BadF-type ATPase
MKLIAESSSTRTEWVLVENSQLIQRVSTEGLNPFFQTRKEISRCIRLELPASFFTKKIDEVFFYGAGCSSYEKKNIIGASLTAQFKAPVQVESDLLAAARGLFLHDSGIACILSTGSNSCFYDGQIIINNVKPGGYILGDEGSAAVLGKLFLADVMKGLAPHQIVSEFFDKFRITPNDVMDSIYNRPFPSRFLATVTYFLINYIDNDYIHNLAADNFRHFFNRCVSQYDYHNYPLRFMGTMANLYINVLHDIAHEYGVTIERIEETPMDGLIAFHEEA